MKNNSFQTGFDDWINNRVCNPARQKDPLYIEGVATAMLADHHFINHPKGHASENPWLVKRPKKEVLMADVNEMESKEPIEHIPGARPDLSDLEKTTKFEDAFLYQ